MRYGLLMVFAVASALSACAEEIGGTVLPMSANLLSGNVGEIAGKLRSFHARGGISRFVLGAPCHSVRVNGILDVDGYAQIGRNLRSVMEAVKADGIEVGYMMLPTVNCGINHPWTHFTRDDGSVRAFTACPGEEGFRKDFAAKCAAVSKAARQPYIMFGDDFRYWDFGCFCDGHLRRFAEKTGVARDRRTLAAGLRRPDARGDELRMAWHLFQTEDLKLLAKAATEAVAEVSPETRLVYCAPGHFPEREAIEIAKVLSGRHRPAIRWWGAVYGYDFPVETAGLLFSMQWAKENQPPEMETLYEADPCPHSRFYASAARMNALISTTAAMGCDEPLFDATAPDYLDLHLREAARYEAIKRETESGRIVGVQVAFNPYVRIGGRGWDAKRPLDEKAWYRTLNCHGIPVTMAEAPVKLFAGCHAFRYMDGATVTNILSGNVFLDGAAAEALTARGFASLIGVRAVKRDRIDFVGEHATGLFGIKRSYPCSFHQNYGLDGCAVSRLEPCGAKNVTEFTSAKKRQSATTWFENSLGGKVAVMAVNLAKCKSPNVFSFAKRELLVTLFRKLGGDRVLPAHVVDRANVMLLANEDTSAGRLFIHATNLSCDPFDSVELEIQPPYAGKRIEILDGDVWKTVDARWNGNWVTVRPSAPVNVYGTLILRSFSK